MEISHNGQYYTVCSDGFDLEEGTIACRQLGFPGLYALKTGRHFGEGTGGVSSVNCRGNEERLIDCAFEQGGCGHEDDVGVICLKGKFCFAAHDMVGDFTDVARSFEKSSYKSRAPRNRARKHKAASACLCHCQEMVRRSIGYK